MFAIFAGKNDLRTSSGKFLRVESCHPESLDFLGLWTLKTLENREEGKKIPISSHAFLNMAKGKHQGVN